MVNSIGGYDTGQRNVFLTGKYGVWINTTGTNNSVVNNYFGTVTGDTLPGGGIGERGVYVQALASYSIISNNLIVGQSDAGIFLWGGNNFVSENIIGLSWNMAEALPNKNGISVNFGDQNSIGFNTIGGNSDYGLYIYHADDNLVYSNFIGYPFGINDLGNGDHGVVVHVSANNQIGAGNTISDNGGDGIYVNGSSNTQIFGNGIGGNDGNGIYMLNSDGTIGGVGTNKLNDIGGNG
ncbi:MAG: right-handed parallel beta-helix repeat-containing protein, partial [Anaerolineales bacterium]|nr:right-handed parallel beta-helix repeat-containing protein [Anaerolineales bacterium]